MPRSRVLAALAAATLLSGPALAHPVDGAWKEVHTDALGITTPKDFKLIIWMKVEGDRLDYYSENTTRPDAPYISRHRATLDGKPAPFPDQPRFKEVSVLLTEPHELQILKMADGDVLSGEFWTFSKDGKTAVRRGISKSPEGKSSAYQEHFVKVADQPKFRRSGP